MNVEYGFRQDWDQLVGRFVFSPRASIAYSPDGAGKTKISGGYGVIHDASSLSMFSRALDQYSITTSYLPDGSPLGTPGMTMFWANGNYFMPRYRNVSLGFEQRMNSLITHPVFDYKVSYRRALELQFRILARVLTGEIPEYVPFLTR